MISRCNSKLQRRLLGFGLALVLASVAGAQDLPRAARPTVSAKELHDGGVVVGDEAFVVLGDQSTIKTTFQFPGGTAPEFNLFRYRDGEDPIPVLTRDQARKYVGLQLAYDPVSGQIATVFSPKSGTVLDQSNQIVLIDPTTSPAQVREVTGNGRLNGVPSFSPDGKWMAFLSGPADAHNHQRKSNAGQTLRVINLATMEEREITPAALGEPIPGDIPVWSPDSRLIALSAFYVPVRSTQIHVVQPDGKGFRTLGADQKYSAEGIVWKSPNELLFTKIGGPGVFQISMSTGIISVFNSSAPYIGNLAVSPNGKVIQVEKVDLATGQMSKQSFDIQGNEIPSRPEVWAYPAMAPKSQ
jgi:hypothetical protein